MHEREPQLEKLVQSVCPPAQGGSLRDHGSPTSTTFSGAVGSSSIQSEGRLCSIRRHLPPADPRDLADSVAFALRFEGLRRFHNSEDGVRASLKARQSRRQEAESSSQRGATPQGGSGRWRRLCSRGSSMRTAIRPADPIKCRTSTQRTRAPESVDVRKRLPPLMMWTGAPGDRQEV